MNKVAHRIIMFAIVFGLVFGISFPALASGGWRPTYQGKVYYVSTTGSDSNPGSSSAPFKTFAKADAVSAPGDTVQVMPGTYTEPMVIKKSGTASAPITWVGNGAKLDMKRVNQTGLKIVGNYITVTNFEVMNATDAGIGVPGQYITVKNNIVHDNETQNGVNGVCGVNGSWSSALKVGGGSNLTIEGNTVYRNCGEGIAVTRGVNVVVKNNTVYDNFAPNIYVDNSPYTRVEGNTVYCTGAVLRMDGKRPTGLGMGEELYDGWGAQMHDVVISGNTVRDCGKGIAAFASEVGGTFTNVTITKNYVPSGEQRPISLSTSPNKNVVISYNTIFQAPYISDPVGVTITGNTISSTAPTPTKVAPTATLVVPTNTNVPPTATLIVPTSTTVAPTYTLAAPPANTLVPVATNTPIVAPTQVPTNTPVAATTDAIFASSFESGNLSDWSGNANGGGDLVVNPSAALVGVNGLQLVLNDNTAMSVSDDRPNAEPRYRARFYFDPNSIVMANGDAHIILRGYHGSSTVALRVEFGYSSGAYQIRAGLVNDGSTFTDTNWFNISDAKHFIELDWRAATGAGANNGGLTLWIDGAQLADLSGIDNDTRRIDRVMLGALAGIDSGTRGTYYFDAFDSRRQSYIGQ